MPTVRRAFLIGLLLAGLTAADAAAQALAGADLVRALRGGGYVLLMRHAASPRTPPSPAAAGKGNPKAERQLDETGRSTATAMGEAIAKLRIPVGQVLSSPTYRALETVRYAKLGEARAVNELGEGGGMQAQAAQASTAWLKRAIGEAPRAGTNTVIVTHFPNIRAAMGDAAKNLADGEALVLKPDGRGGAALVARVPIEQWPKLAAAD